MQTFIEKSICDTAEANEAERILRACVHCGFCNATCPTYQVLGDELDGPRGRIYLIKSMLQGEESSERTMQHLDRCLSCRACETTCPSGVEYGKLLDIGRNHVTKKVSRPWQERIFRFSLLQLLPYKKRFNILFKLGQWFRVCLPADLIKVFPAKTVQNQFVETQLHPRKVVLFSGCVQPALAPEINQALTKVLDYFAVSVINCNGEQCCGAMSHHLSATEQAEIFMKKNIDLYWPLVEQGAEAIIVSASGCGVHIKEYGYLLREDKEYANKAIKISAMTKDISEYISEFNLEKLNVGNVQKVAFQSPCTLQHGQNLSGVTEELLSRIGFSLTDVVDSHLCCGSAGTYSLLEKDLSRTLRENKIESLMQGKPEMILTANIGCLTHLKQKAKVPVRHWIEEVAALIT